MFLLFLAGLASGRILYELFFPSLLWLGRPAPAFLVAGLVAILAYGGWRWRQRRAESSQSLTKPKRRPLTLSAKQSQVAHLVTLSPLLLNLLYLFSASVDLVGSRFIFAASLWLMALLTARMLARPKSWRWLGVVFVVAALLPVYLMTMPHTVGRADTFEFQVVVPQLGVAHPTGYPLYLLLGKLFTFLPAGSVAWRLNFASTVYALAAASLTYGLAYRFLQRPLPALLGAVALGLTPTFWSQAIEAEVYTLHALVVAAALWLMGEVGDWRLEIGDWGLADGTSVDGTSVDGTSVIGDSFVTKMTQDGKVTLLAFVLGLGLTNHLTSVFLLPPAALTIIFSLRAWPRQSPISSLESLLRMSLAFILPLSLYAYLPLRWAAVNEEAMGFGRFVDWVTGGRFQGALQWSAWLNDPARYEVVGRLFLDNWGWFNLLLALVGFTFLFWRHRRAALALFATWFGYTFYCLNYYVPDLAVFLIPAHIIVAIWWMAGLILCYRLLEDRAWRLRLSRIANFQSPMEHRTISILFFIPTLLLASNRWSRLDLSQDDGLMQWGAAVLAQPLETNAAILADSEKIAPLYYLQQTEGIRPDLDIMVLPDEAAYRSELDRRIAAGQTVYLARFLPGLAGVYHLRSLGPLVEVSREPLTSLPAGATPGQIDFGPIQLAGYEIEARAAADPAATAVTLYWQATEPAAEVRHVYTRWAGESFTGHPDVATGQHPAGNYYPTNAWRPGEIVPDYHQWPRPILNEVQTLSLQVAVAPPFTPASELNWRTVTEVEFAAAGHLDLARPQRAQIGPWLLDGAEFPGQIRPQTPLPVLLSGFGDNTPALELALQPSIELQPMAHRPIPNLQSPISNLQSPISNPQSPFIQASELSTDLPNGRYQVVAFHPQYGAVCGWLRPMTAGCSLGEVEISGVPLAEGAVNFDDKIALLDIDVSDFQLQPGGRLPVTLTWQALATIDQDYTVFVQILNEQDQIVGQVDAWPRQGTYPTSQWRPGEIVQDPYVVQLQADLPPGEFRLQIGWYLLATLRRLPVLDEGGAPVDDKVVMPGLFRSIYPLFENVIRSKRIFRLAV